MLLTAFVMIGSGFADHAQAGERAALDPWGRVLLFVSGALLLWRWRHPVAVLGGTVAAVLVYLGAGYPYGPVFLTVVVACFTAVVSGRRYAAWAAMGTLWAGHLLLVHLLYRWLPPPGTTRPPGPRRSSSPPGWWPFSRCPNWPASAVSSGRASGPSGPVRNGAAPTRSGCASPGSCTTCSRTASPSSTCRLGVGLALLDSDPEQARTALTTIKAQSKEALGEVRQVLDTLRAPGAAPRAPAPGLDRLPDLVKQAAGAGLTVTVEGEPPRLSPGADLAAFRIVQEALTNVVRHSGSREARVRVERRAGRLRLLIDDDGPATGADAGGTGNGLAGMRERAAALGGTIEAGTRPDGGFRVLAVLPIEAEEDR